LKKSPSGKPTLDPQSPSKILVLRLRRIGDIVLTTPVLSALKKAFPLASLTYVVEEPYVRLVEDNPALDGIISLKPKSSVRESWQLIRRIRKERFDAVLDLHGGPRTSLLTFFSRAGIKVGYLIRGRGWPYDIAIPRSRPEGPIHSIENHLNLVRALGIPVKEEPALFLPPPRPAEIAGVDRFFKGNKLKGSKIVVLHIGSGNIFRDWGSGNWSALARRLAAMRGVRVVLMGGPEDRGREKEILEAEAVRALSLVGRLSLAETREVIGRASLFIGPDSGPMHIAASTPTPIVALFGPNLSAYNAPRRRRVVIIEKDLDCRPCRQKECRTGDFRCLRTISVDEVFKAGRPFLLDKKPKK